MKTLKKLTMLLVVVMIAALVVSGCTPSQQTKATPGSTPDSQTKETEGTDSAVSETLEKVKLYGYLLGSALPGFPDVMEELNKKLEEDINATMEINYIGWGDLAAKYPLILAAGENVDWIYTAAWCQMATEAAKGAFMEITPEIYQKYMPRHYAKIKDTTALSEVAVNGKTYMIPTSTPDKKCDVTIYRQDLVEKYNLPPIEKFSDLEALAEAVKENEPGMIPISGDNNYDVGQVCGKYYLQNNELCTDIKAFVGSDQGVVYKNFDTDGKLYIVSDDPELLPKHIEAAKYANSWYRKGYINHDILSNKVRSKEALVHGKCAIAFGNSIDIQGNISAAEASGMKIGIIPSIDVKGRAAANAYTNNGIAIAATSKNWERALMAMDLIMQEPSYVFLVYYGIEGVNYIIKDGKIGVPEGVTAENNTYPLDQAGFWFVNKDLFLPQDDWTDSYIKLVNDLPGYLTTDTLANFTAVTDNIKSEVANCTQVMNQYNLPLIAGAIDDVEGGYAPLKEKLEAAGVRKVKDEIQKQINDFLAN
jgi:putative aldouronate transport system substrate-binding protein